MFPYHQSTIERFSRPRVVSLDRSALQKSNNQNSDVVLARKRAIAMDSLPPSSNNSLTEYSSRPSSKRSKNSSSVAPASINSATNGNREEIAKISFDYRLMQKDPRFQTQRQENGKATSFITAKQTRKRLFISFAVAIVLVLLMAFVISTVLKYTLRTTIATSSTTSTTTTTTTATTTTSTTATTSSTTSSSSSTSTTTTSTSTSTTTTTTTTTSSLLPAQCFSYVTNNDSTRNVNYSGTTACDSTVFGNGTWVRFVSLAGTQLPTTAPTVYYCGTHATGWFTGSYPTAAGNTTSGTVCYNWSGNTCNWSNSIQVTNCITFYVFFLINTSQCSLRYCTV